jgi:hypothetical protein
LLSKLEISLETQPLGLPYATCWKDSKLELSNLTLTICSNVTIINLNQQLRAECENMQSTLPIKKNQMKQLHLDHSENINFHRYNHRIKGTLPFVKHINHKPFPLFVACSLPSPSLNGSTVYTWMELASSIVLPHPLLEPALCCSELYTWSSCYWTPRLIGRNRVPPSSFITECQNSKN